MNSRRHFLTLSKTLLAGLLLSSALTPLAQAQTASVEEVAAIEFSGLEKYNGLYASVIYGINNSILYNNSASAYLTKIRKQTEPQVISNGRIKVSAQKLARQGIFEGYNSIVVVVHMQSRLDWMNADNSVPEGASLGPNSDFKSVLLITKKDFQKQYLGQGMPELVQIKL